MPVLPARTPSLPCSESELKPGKPRSTMKAVMPLCPCALIDRGEDQEVIGGIGQADPDLAAVQEVAVAVAARGGGQVGGIATRRPAR